MTQQRIQLRFRKEGDLRYLGHRDILRSFERIFRRAGLQLRRTEGFHPRAKMSFPLALAVGIAGTEEIVEIELDEPMELDDVLAALERECPPGLAFHSPRVLAAGEKNVPVSSVTIELPIPAERHAALAARIAELLAAETWPIVRETRRAPIDLRPLVKELALRDAALVAELWIIREAGVRPRELLSALGVEDLESLGCRLTRTRVELQSSINTDRRKNRIET